MNKFVIALLLGLLAVMPARAQSEKNMPAVSMTSMPSSVDLNDPMSQEASGTSWIPSSTPVYARMMMKPNGDMLMVHGAIMPRYVDVGSRRGDRRVDAPNWFMGMYGHPLGASDQVGVRVMMSLDPITEGGYGYPLLYQTGETWHHQALHDRQHPHDLFDELAVSYSHLLGGGKSTYLYIGYPGEPALGPPAYMHRLLASDYADAPIGHHWQDATHITFGVATAGINFGSKVKAEVSDFTGREPDENRYSFDKPRFDSYSGRVSFNPDAENALQLSYGLIHNPEGDWANVHRTTASWVHNKPLGGDSNLQTAFVWGLNDNTIDGNGNSYLAEADYQRGVNTVFTRIENIQKSGNELVLPAPLNTSRKYDLGAYTVGYVRDLSHGKGIDTGVGFAVTADTKPAALDSIYGKGMPVSFELYFRLRPSRTGAHLSATERAHTETNGNSSGVLSPPPAAPSVMPGTPTAGGVSDAASSTAATASQVSPPQSTATLPSGTNLSPVPYPTVALSVSVRSVTGTISPNPPRARIKNTVTVVVVGTNDKPILGARITASVAMTEMDMGTTHPSFKELGKGRYQAIVQFSMSGQWRVQIDVLPAGSGKPATVVQDYDVAH